MIDRPKLPFRITLLLGLVLIVTVLSAIRFWTAISWRNTLETYTSAGLVLYAAISGAFWTLVGLALLWAFHRRARHIRNLLLGAAVLYALWAWADRLFVQASLRASWLFDLLLTMILLAFAALVLLDPRNQSYFRRESHDRKPENPTSA